MAEGVVDTLSGDDVGYLRKLVDDLRDRGPIDLSLVTDHCITPALTSRLDHRRFAKHLMSDLISVEDFGAQASKLIRHEALAAGDSTHNADDLHPVRSAAHQGNLTKSKDPMKPPSALQQA